MSTKEFDEKGKGRESSLPAIDEQLLDVGLRLSPAECLLWLEETVEGLLRWLGLASLPESESAANP